MTKKKPPAQVEHSAGAGVWLLRVVAIIVLFGCVGFAFNHYVNGDYATSKDASLQLQNMADDLEKVQSIATADDKTIKAMGDEAKTLNAKLLLQETKLDSDEKKLKWFEAESKESHNRYLRCLNGIDELQCALNHARGDKTLCDPGSEQ